MDTRLRNLMLAASVAAGPAAACGGQHAAGGDEGLLDDFGETGVENPGGESDGDQPGTDDGGQPMDGIPATGLTVSRVTANQGVQVNIGLEGEGVDGSGRAAPLVRDRTTSIRAHVRVDPGFTPRTIEARLTLSLPDGTSPSVSVQTSIDGDSADSDVGSTFAWSVTPDVMVPDVRYQVGLYELEPSAESDDAPPNLTPVTGPAYVGIEASPTEILMVAVPVRHVFGGCDSTPNISSADVGTLERILEQYHPIANAHIEVGPPLTYTSTLGGAADFQGLLAAMGQRRTADAVGPNVYYYGFVNSCDGLPSGGVVGQSFNIPSAPAPELAYMRVAVGRWINVETAASTFIHEFGHTEGRYHVACSGNEGFPDNAYPHNGGVTGVWGWGVHDGHLYSPTQSHDYMTYCGNYWSSDYGWNHTYEVAAALTSWSAAAQPESEVIIGSVMPDGSSTWWTAPGGLLDSTDGASLDLHLEGSGEPVNVPVLRFEPTDSVAHGGHFVVAPLIAPSRELTGLTVRHGIEAVLHVDRDALSLDVRR